MKQLEVYGWNETFAERFDKLRLSELQPGRVIADFGTSLKVAIPETITAELSGKLAHYTVSNEGPKVGDWVALRRFDDGHAVIESTIPRLNEVTRKVTGKQTKKQIIAANVDIAFILLALDKDFSVDRLRRFLFQLSSQHVSAVIVLNKADKTDTLDSFTAQLSAFDLPIVVTSAINDIGIDLLKSHIGSGKTAILLGSSGVGKSTITNKLLGREVQPTKEVRKSDDTGQHTTVHRELFVLNHGGLLIDTPGIRELQLWGTEEDLGDNFDDITSLIIRCKYTSCRHSDEEGCAVRHALEQGSLDQSRYAAYLKMKRELTSLKERTLVKKRLSNAKNKRSRARQERDKALDEHENY